MFHFRFNVKAEENNNTEFEFELGTSFLIPSISLASVTKNTKCLKVTGKTNDNRDIEVSETREKKVSEQTFPFLPLATIKEKESTKEIVIKTGRDVKKIVKKSSNTSICLLGIPIFGQLECDSDSD